MYFGLLSYIIIIIELYIYTYTYIYIYFINYLCKIFIKLTKKEKNPVETPTEL